MVPIIMISRKQVAWMGSDSVTVARAHFGSGWVIGKIGIGPVITRRVRSVESYAEAHWTSATTVRRVTLRTVLHSGWNPWCPRATTSNNNNNNKRYRTYTNRNGDVRRRFATVICPPAVISNGSNPTRVALGQCAFVRYVFFLLYVYACLAPPEMLGPLPHSWGVRSVPSSDVPSAKLMIPVRYTVEISARQG